MPRPSKNTWAKVAIFIATVIWGSSFVVLKNALDNLSPFFVLFVRGGIASLVLIIIFYRQLKELNKSLLLASGIAGTILFVAYGFQTQGLVGTTPGKNAFLTSVYCILVPFFYWIFTRIRPHASSFLAAFICLLGIGLISLQQPGQNSTDLIALGDVLTLISGIFYAMHIIAIARFASRKQNVILLTVVQFWFFTLWAGVASFLFEPLPTALSWNQGLSLLYLGVFASAIALSLQSIGQKRTPASQTALILSLEGVMGVIFSVLFFGEKLTLRLILGFLLVFIAIVISETKMNIRPMGYVKDTYARWRVKKDSTYPPVPEKKKKRK